jgi:hypothetical protein
VAVSAAAGQSVPAADPRPRARPAVRALAHESLPVVVGAVFVGLLAALVPNLLASDGWLALVGGRAIAHHGLPHHDQLAVLTHGRAWVDQQWLGQLATYGIASAAGIRGLLAVNVLLVAGAFAAAIVLARRRGGRPSSVAWVGVLSLLPFLVAGMNVRTQTLAYPLFVALLVLLTRPGRIEPRRTVLLLGILVVWANVHGSVLLAALLVSARGAVELRATRRDRIAETLLVAPWLCVLVSPYHVHLVSYYASTAFNPSFSSYLSQWAPTKFSPIAAPLLVLLFAAIWLLGRTAGTYSAYERVLLVVAVVLGLLAVRNWPFSALLLLQLTPVGLDQALRRRPEREAPPIGAVVAGVAAIAAVVGTVAALGHSESGLAKRYPPAAADAAARAVARTGGPVYGGVQYSDWLLWRHPELAGRVVFDVRSELLNATELKRLVFFDAGSGLDRPLGGPRVYVLDPKSQDDAVAGLRGNVRTVYETERALVAVSRKTS